MIAQPNTEDSQLYGNRQLKKIYNLPQRRPSRDITRPPPNIQFPEQYPPFPLHGQNTQAYVNPAMDHLTLAFDQAIQNLGVFLDTLTAPPPGPYPGQMGVSGMNTVIIDYLNLLEACCVNHPMLKSKIQMITQKLVALQNTGTLPVNHGGPLASFSFSQPSRPVPNPGAMMMPATPPMIPPAPTLHQHMPNFYGPIGMNPPPMPPNRSRPTPFQMDANRANQGYRMNVHNYFPNSSPDFFPTPNPSPPLNAHQSLLLSEGIAGFPPSSMGDATVTSSNTQIL